MPFLEKRNPRATRTSVIKASLCSAIVVMGLLLFQWRVGRLPVSLMWFMIPSMVIAGAVIGGTAEWQWPPEGFDRERSLQEAVKEQEISK